MTEGVTSGATTKACPMCGEQIQRAAIKCKYCGSDLAQAVQAGAATEARNSAGNANSIQFNQKLSWVQIVGGLVVGAVAIVICAFIANSPGCGR